MKISKTIFVAVCLVVLSQLVWSQQAVRRDAARGIPGYLDPKTGTFTTKAQPQAEEANPSSSAYYYGTFKINLTATLTTAVPSGGAVTCSSDVDEYGDPDGSYSEKAAAVATHVSGAKWTCDMVIPYIWWLGGAATDALAVSYSMGIYEAFTVGSTSTIVTVRQSSFDAPAIVGVPAAGTTTTLSYGVDL